ncbi:MAG: hypothetical protein KBF77_06135, partial [Paludibacteraceae bacterium]|nr:hypothetical protein [Paludibacteraceae bacterium]
MKRASFKPIILILGLIFNLNLFGQTITVVPSTTVCKGTQVTLTINGAINWEWDDGTTSPNYIKTVNSSLDVTVELFDENWIKPVNYYSNTSMFMPTHLSTLRVIFRYVV